MNRIIKKANNIRLKRGWGIKRLSREITISYATLRRAIRGIGRIADYNLEKVDRWLRNYKNEVNNK